MKPIKHKVEVEIRDIQVDERYYSFKYTIKIDGKKKSGEFESDYVNGMTPKEWMKNLKNGGALEDVLELRF